MVGRLSGSSDPGLRSPVAMDDQRDAAPDGTDTPAGTPTGIGEMSAASSATTVNRWRQLVDRGKGTWTAQRTAGEARLGRWREGNPLVDCGALVYERDREIAATVLGSAVAFRLFLFFVPLLLFVVGLVGILATWVSSSDASGTAGVTGALADQLASAMEQSSQGRWVMLLAGVWGMLSAGRALGKVLVASSCLSWRLPVQRRAPVRVVGAVVGLVTSMALISVITNRIRAATGFTIASLSFVVVAVIYLVIWLFVLLTLPRPTRDPGALLPGAALVAVALSLMQAFTQLYLPGRMSRASQLYGGLGAIIVTLGWFFILGRLIVVGMAANAAVYERFGSISQVVFSLPVVRILPRRSPRLARFFGLDEAVSPSAGEPDHRESDR